MNYLVGYTGFVGSNLVAKHDFDNLFNSKNIEEAFGGNPDLLVYSGVRAEVFLANKDPEGDLTLIDNAIENIKKIMPQKIVLISTIDIYKDPHEVDEDSTIETEGLLPYGANRYYLEKWVEENIPEHLIVRLPALYGLNIKKNFLYDYINLIPTILTEAKFKDLTMIDAFIEEYYFMQDNGFYQCNVLKSEEKKRLKGYFEKVGFSALNFTDSRARYQFYNLGLLWGHICKAMEHGVRKLNLATEPITVAELYEYLKGQPFVNELPKIVLDYDYRTKHAELFGGADGYILKRNYVLDDIKKFCLKMIV